MAGQFLHAQFHQIPPTSMTRFPPAKGVWKPAFASIRISSLHALAAWLTQRGKGNGQPVDGRNQKANLQQSRTQREIQPPQLSGGNHEALHASAIFAVAFIFAAPTFRAQQKIGATLPAQSSAPQKTGATKARAEKAHAGSRHFQRIGNLSPEEFLGAADAIARRQI